MLDQRGGFSVRHSPQAACYRSPFDGSSVDQVVTEHGRLLLA
jgi:hypothetical protein